MKFIKLFEDFDNEIVVSFGDYVLTKHDLDTKYRQKIKDYYGKYNDDTIINATWTLRDIANIYDNGGDLMRAVWLKDINDFNVNEMGFHYVIDKNDLDNIIYIFKEYVADDEDYIGKEPYVIEVHTPPHNVNIPSDYWNNLDEHEIMVEDDKKLKFIKIYKY